MSTIINDFLDVYLVILEIKNLGVFTCPVVRSHLKLDEDAGSQLHKSVSKLHRLSAKGKKKDGRKTVVDGGPKMACALKYITFGS